MRLDTIEQVQEALRNLEPVYIESKTHGKILVPCSRTLLVNAELVVANTYNPNSIPDDRMKLLQESIVQNGFCFPVVTIYDEDMGKFVVIDGFHRKFIGSSAYLDLDYLPLVVLSHDITQRMTATMQFNRARGMHQVDLDAEVVRALVEQGMPEEDIATKLGMDIDTVHRYKQITGVAEIFKNTAYSQAWEMEEGEEPLP